MKKWEVTLTQTRITCISIEANTKGEAEQLVGDRIRKDEYFCDEIEARYENGVVDEEITAKESDDEWIDYTYDEMRCAE